MLMNTLRNHTQQLTDQTGFGVVALLVVIVVLTSVGGAGYYVWSQNNQASPEDAGTESSQSMSSEDEASEISQDDNTADATESPEVENVEDDAPSTQYDNAVRNDMSRIMAELNNYAANNNGSFPFTQDDLAEFEDRYLGPLDLTHPESGLSYTLDTSNDGSEYISFAPGVCNEDGIMQPGGSSRQVSLATQLPSGETHCVDNA